MQVYLLRVNTEGLDDPIFGIFTSKIAAENLRSHLIAQLAPQHQSLGENYYIQEMCLDTYYSRGRP